MLITGEPDRCPSSSLWRAERSRLRQQCSDPQVGLTLRHDTHINRLILSERWDALWQRMTEAVIEAISLPLNLEMDPEFQVPSDKTMRHCSATRALLMLEGEHRTVDATLKSTSPLADIDILLPGRGNQEQESGQALRMKIEQLLRKDPDRREEELEEEELEEEELEEEERLVGKEAAERKGNSVYF